MTRAGPGFERSYRHGPQGRVPWAWGPSAVGAEEGGRKGEAGCAARRRVDAHRREGKAGGVRACTPAEKGS